MRNKIQQPVNVWEALSQAILLWIESLRHLWMEALIFSLLSAVPIYFKDVFKWNSIVESIVFVFCLFSALLFSNVAYAKIYSLAQNTFLTRSQAFAVGLLKWPAAIGVSIIIMMGIGILGLASLKIAVLFMQAISPQVELLILMLLLLIVSTYASCIFPLIIIENRKIFSAIHASIALVHRHWWYAASLWLFAIIFSEAINAIAYKIAGISGTVIGGMFTMPLHVTMLITIYQQLTFRATIK